MVGDLDRTGQKKKYRSKIKGQWLGANSFVINILAWDSQEFENIKFQTGLPKHVKQIFIKSGERTYFIQQVLFQFDI
jgi:hypothetical protein